MGAAWMAGGGAIESEVISSKLKIYAANALQTGDATSYSNTRRDGSRAVSVAVLLTLSNPDAEPWTAAGASLVDSTGEQVDLAAWQAAPIPPAGQAGVVVGTQRERGQLACPCSLKLWEAQGPRTVTLGNVTFPDAPMEGP